MTDISSNKILKKKLRYEKKMFFKRYYPLYILLLPGLLYYILFKYIPMFGLMIAFKDFMPFEGIEGILSSGWVGFKHFERFFASSYSWEIIRNTFLISFYKILFGFPAPIVLALLINEVRATKFKKIVQTISYLPHFLSWVVVAGLVRTLLSGPGSLVNGIIEYFGGEEIFFLGDSRYFRSILVLSSIWQSVGWGTIIYLAAMSGINPQLYEAATIDGASWFQRIKHVTVPGIMPVITIMLILRVGGILNAGFQQIFLLYSPMVYDVSDVISTHVYRVGLKGMNYSYGTAIGLFKSVIALVFILGTNMFAKKLGQEGIW